MLVCFIEKDRYKDKVKDNPTNTEMMSIMMSINRTLIGHERAIVHFLVLPGSPQLLRLLSTHIFSLIWTGIEFKHKSD